MTPEPQIGAKQHETPAENLAASPPPRDEKHKRSWGETLFNLTTYGGFALVGNEATASYIVGKAESPGLIGRAFRSCGNFFQGLGKPGALPYLQERINYINFAILGGFLMVPIIKLLEDNKGRCVRFADRIIYGSRADTDPNIIKKHEEMDNAPVQTWGSLGRGRVLTVAAAYTVDSTINWDKGISARLLKGTRLENYGSFQHLSNHATEWLFKKMPGTSRLSPERSLVRKKFLGDLVGLTTLSAMLTVLFYFSSKLFAKKRDEKLERREYARAHPDAPRDEAETPDATTLSTPDEQAKKAERPSLQVTDAVHEKTVEASAAVQAGV